MTVTNLGNIGTFHPTKILGFAANPSKSVYDPGEWVIFTGRLFVHIFAWWELENATVYIISDEKVVGVGKTDWFGKFTISVQVPLVSGYYVCQAQYNGTWNYKSCASETILLKVGEPPEPPPPPNGNGEPPSPPGNGYEKILLYCLAGAAAAGLIWLITKGVKRK